MQFTERFIRDAVIPEIESTGGATVLTSPYGMPPALLRMDKYQPPTWVVGLGAMPLEVSSTDLPLDWDLVHAVANRVLDDYRLNSWSAVGFWMDEGVLYIEPVATYTNHYMAIEAAKDAQQLAIYALHTGATEWLPARDALALLLPSFE